MGINKKIRGKSALVGLDIQANSIAGAEVVKNQPGIKSAAISDLPTGLVREGEILDEDGLGSALKSFVREHRFNPHVRLGVANQRVVVRTVEVPALEDQKELDAAVRFTAGEHLPMPLDEAVIDYEVIERIDGDNGSPRNKIILVAAPKEMVERIVAVSSKAGLKLEGIDLSAFALIRALHGTTNGNGASANQPTDTDESENPEDSSDNSPGATGYCHLGAVTNLAVAHGPACVFARSISYGVDSMVEEMAQRKDVSVTDARAWLTHVGLNRDLENIEGDPEMANEARDVLKHCSTMLANELQDSLDFYATQPDALTVVRTLVTGPGVEIEGLLDAIDEGTPIPMEATSPQIDQDIDVSPPLLALAYGLALDEVVA